MCRSLCRTNAISYGGRIRYGGTDDYKIVYVDHVDITALKPEYSKSWWRHQMDIFSALLSLCESPLDPSKGQGRGALIFLFDLCLNKRLSKQSRRRWFETPSRSLCRQCNVMLLGLRSVISMLLLFKQQPKIQRDKIALKEIEKSKNHYPVVHQSSQQLNDNRWYTDIKNNAWVTVNNDFLSRVRRFGNDFHEWRSHEWKSLPNRLTSDKKDRYSR